MAFESKLWRVKILFLLFAAKIHSYSCTLDFVHIKLKCLFVVLFLLFNCKELSVVVKISSYSSISDGVLRHIVQGKYSRHLMLMQIVDHITEHLYGVLSNMSFCIALPKVVVM
jgi:hypothetical protein